MTTELPTRYKGRYPFRLACPSFIYPAGYTDNVRRLGPCVDEIELLFLESAPESLPSTAEINELSAMAGDCDITFNIHLPTDVSPGADKPGVKSSAVDALLRVIERSRPLAAVSYTIHIPFTASPGDPGSVADWQHRVRKNLERLLVESGLPAGAIALETLDYPFYYLDDMIRETGCSICLDTGHLMVREENCRAFYQDYQEDIIIIHTHGVINGRDHQALSRLSQAQSEEISHILRHFRQSLSLEVFSIADLGASLDYLDRIWKNLSQSKHE